MAGTLAFTGTEKAMLLKELTPVPCLLVGLVALPFSGCETGDDKDSDTDAVVLDTSDDDDTVDTSVFAPDGGLELEALAVFGAAFAFDPVEGAFVTSQTGTGEDHDPWIAISGTDAAGEGCTTFLSKPGPIAPSERSYVAAEGLYAALDMPPDATVETDCDTIEINDPAWLELIAGIPDDSWGIGVGPLDSETAKYAADYYGGYFGEYEPTLLSVGWYWSRLEGTSFAPNGYMSDPVGFSAELDDAFVPVTDADGVLFRLEAEDVVNPAGGLNKGIYILEQSFFSIIFQ